MLLLNVAISLAGSLLLALVLTVLGNIATCWLARKSFRRRTRGLPILSGAQLVGNHAHNVLLGKRLAERLRRCHELQGSTVGWLRGSEFCVSTTDLDLVKTFVLDEPNRHLDRMDLRVPLHEINNNIITARGEQWRSMRRAIAPALTPAKFKTRNVQEEIQSSIAKLIDLIELRLDSCRQESAVFVLDADDYFVRYSGDLVYKSFYKQDNLIDFKAESDEGAHEIETAMNMMRDSWLVYLGTIFPQLLRPVEWLSSWFTPLGRIKQRLRNFIEEQANRRRAAREQWPELKRDAEKRGVLIDPQDFMLKGGSRYKQNMADHIIDQFIDGKLSKADFVNNNFFLMLAGFRTAADCLIHTSYLLAVNQDVQDKLRHSIAADGLDSEYLDWVLRESLRLLPPAPIGCSRTISRDIELSSGHLLPKGTYVLAHAHVIHRLKKYWGEDADEFRPERWRDTSNHHPLQWVPFGAGVKGCPGRQFAMHEMKMLLVAILSKYKLTGEPRADVYEFDCPYNMFIQPKSHTKIAIRRL